MRITGFLSIILLTGLMLSIATSVQSQTVAGDKKTGELVLGVPKISDKTLPDLKEAITKTKATEFVAYCPSHQLVLVNYDERTFTSKQAVVDAIMIQKIELTLYIKEGGFNEARELCSE
jgi:hypothetical protein